MAFNLSAVLTMSAKGIKGSLGRANKELSKLKSQMQKARGQARAVGTGLRSVGIVGIGMAAGIGIAVKSYMDFERQMDSVKAKMLPTKKEYQAMSDIAKQLGAQTIFTGKQAAQGLEYLALAGFKAKDAIAVLPTLLYTAGAGALELGKASDIITDSMSAMLPVMTKYGSKQKQAKELADMMALAQANTNTNIEQLGEAIKYGGGAMSNMQIPLEQIIGSMGALADAGIKGSSAGTSLVNMMGKLAKPTSRAISLMDDMGISMEDIKTPEGKLKRMDQVMMVFSKALEKNPDMLEKAGVAMEIFGKRGQKAFFALQNKGGKSLKLLFDKLAQASKMKDAEGNIVGASKAMYEIMTDNIYGAWESFKSATGGITLNMGQMISSMFNVKKILQTITKPLSTFSIALGNAMKPMSEWSPMAKKMMKTPIGQFALGVASAFKDIRTTLISLYVKFKSFVGMATKGGEKFKLIGSVITKVAIALALIGPPLLGIGLALVLLTPIVTGAVSAIGLLGTIFTMLTGPIGITIVVIGALSYALYQMMGGWEGITSAAKSFASGFMESWTPLWKSIQENLMPTINDLKKTFGDLFESLFGKSTNASNDFSSFGKTIGTVAGRIVKALSYPIKLLMKVVNLFGKIANFGVGKIKSVLGFFGVGKGTPEMDIAKKEQKTGNIIDLASERVKRRGIEPMLAEDGSVKSDIVTDKASTLVSREDVARTKAATMANNINVSAPNVNIPEQQTTTNVGVFIDGEEIFANIEKRKQRSSNQNGNQVRDTSLYSGSQSGYGG